MIRKNGKDERPKRNKKSIVVASYSLGGISSLKLVFSLGKLSFIS